MSDEAAANDALAESYNRGLAAEAAGDLVAAQTAYHQVLELDPKDHGGVAIRLAALGLAPSPAVAPEAYVATLFDQNAHAFDDMLVEQLGYSVPMLVRERLDDLGLGPFDKLLDLGCGTGLTGASMLDRVMHVTGVDLSEQMLDEAAERDCYDALYVGEAVAFLEDAEMQALGPWNVITATDVLPYLGALERFMAGVQAALAPGGLIIVSTEALPPDEMRGQDYIVGPKRRYAHAFSYLEELLAAHQLASLECLSIIVRYDEGVPITGYLIIAQAPC
ncbi:MAG: methyltransferase [Pseudomonadota bacterium]